MARKRKAPPGCYWRNGTLWGRARVKGHEIRWSLHTADPAIAAQRYVDGKRNAQAQVYHDDAPRAFVDILEQWVEWAKRNIKGAKTRQRYACSLDQIRPFLEDRKLSEITGKLVGTIIKARQDEDVTNATIKRDLVALSSVMNFCIDETWIEANPVLPRMKRLKEYRDPIVLPQHAHIDMVIARAPGMIKDMMRAAMVTGAREDELLRLTQHSIDHGRRQLTVTGKGNKVRVFDLDPFGGYEVLRALPAYVGSSLMFWHSAGENYKNFASQFSAIVRDVFFGAYDAVHRTNDASRPHIDDLLEAQDQPGWRDVGFRPFRFHDLRHLHAVEFLKAGHGDLYALKDRLGHTSVKTTEMYLAHLTVEEKRRAIGGGPVAAAGPRLAVVRE